MNYPLSQLSSTGTNLVRLSEQLKNLAQEVDGINSSILSCYGNGGVGGRTGGVASAMRNHASMLCQYGEVPNRACSLYSNATSNIQMPGQQSNTYNSGNMCTMDAVTEDKYSSNGVVNTDESWLKKYLGNDLKTSGSIKSYDTPMGDLELGAYKAKIENSFSGDFKKGDVGVGVKASAGISGVRVSNEGSAGVAYGKYDVQVGTVSGEAEAKVNIINDGKIKPEVAVSAKAEGKLLSGELEGGLGNDDFNVHAKGEGAIGTAKAEGKLAFSAKEGISGKGEVGAAVFSGKATAGFTILGVKIDASVKGEALAVGAEAEFGASSNSFELGGKLSFLAGIGLKIKVSW